MKIINYIFLLLFVLSAALQYNDPDPYIWIPLYLYGAFLCYRTLKGKRQAPLYLAGLCVYLPYALYLFFAQDGVYSWWRQHGAEDITRSMKADRPWIEATREFFGLVLLSISLLLNWAWEKRKERVAEDSRTPVAMKSTAFLFFLLLAGSESWGQESFWTAQVRDEKARPLSGATITILGRSTMVQTDSNGSFRLNPSEKVQPLLIRAAGYADLYREVGPSATASDLSFTLYPSYQQLDAVVVSAQKKEELLHRAPLSVTALTGRDVEAYRLWNLEELTAIVANLNAADPGDNRNVTSLRGVASTGYDQAVATYVDGVNQFGLDTYIPQLFDVERIEVLKGPQGTLYGRNAMGGVVQVITRRPGNTTEGVVQATAGNYGQQRYTASLRTPLVKEKLYLGAAALFEKRNGFYTNAFTGSDYDRKKSTMGNYYLRYTPAGWDLHLNVKHLHHRNRGPFPLVMPFENALKQPFQVNQDALTQMKDDHFNASFSAQHTGKALRWSSQTSYQRNYRYYDQPIDADFSPADAITIINNYGKDWNWSGVWTQEVNLHSLQDVGRRFNWSAGTYLFLQRNPVRQATRFGRDAQLLGMPDNNFSLINTARNKGSGAALYGQLGYALTSKLELIAGLRYDREQRSQQVLGEYQKDGDPSFEYRGDTSASVTFDAFSPKLSLVFTPKTEQTIYLSFARGFRTGGLTPLSSDPSQPALYPFRPEYSSSFEGGWKSRSGNGRTSLQLSLFYTIISDVQVPTLVLPEAVTITRNTGRLVSKGIESELRLLLLKGLLLDQSLGYTHARYDAFLLSVNGAEKDLKGNRQVFTPDLTSMTALQYSYTLGKKRSLLLSLRGEWKYLGRQYFDPANTLEQLPYHLLNLQLRLAFTGFELSLWGRNIADRRYISYAYDFGAAHLGEPRTYGVTVKVGVSRQ